jgi:hypothetical protein
MIADALIVGLALSSQLSATDSRYPIPAAGQPGASAPPAAGNSAGNASDTSRSAFETAGTVPGANRNTNDMFAPAGGEPNSLRGSPPATSTPPRTLPLLDNDTRPISAADSSRPTATAYEVSPNQPVGTASPNGAGLSPSAMMRAMLNPLSGSQLRGQPVALVEVVTGARSRGEQTERVETYWDLCSSVADYYLGLREQDELRRYVQRGGQAWDQFELEMRNRTGTAQRAALASQLRLASMMGRGSGFLPLPADTPHCASYHTHFDKIFPRGGPQEAKELADLLPLRYSELKGAAASVAESEQYLNSFASTRSGDIDGGLHALNLLALRRRAFVQIARDYNRRIARYTELASPGQVSPERLTGMLIKSSVSTATKSASPAPSLNRQTNRKEAPPSTFVEGGSSTFKAATPPSKQDEAVQPASRVEPSSAGKTSPRREHSLLVKPPE